jgi:hypothetical protein
MRDRIFVTLAVIALVELSSCSSLPSTAEVRQQIEANLKPGDPESKVVAYLNQAGFHPVWFVNRYQCSYPRTATSIVGEKTNIVIYVYLNEDRSFKKAEAENIYTYL